RPLRRARPPAGRGEMPEGDRLALRRVGRHAGTVERPSQELPQRRLLLGGNAGEDLVLNAHEPFLAPGHCPPTRLSELDDMAAASHRIPPAQREDEGFELV